jgi:hypothetical protein
MVYLIDPKAASKEVCIFYCATKCWPINTPLYGIPN